MKYRLIPMTPCLIALLAASAGLPAWAQSSELDQLKVTMESMQKAMREMQAKINQLEQERARAPGTNALSATSPSIQTIEKVAAGVPVGHPSPIVDRESMRDYQEGAPRP